MKTHQHIPSLGGGTLTLVLLGLCLLTACTSGTPTPTPTHTPQSIYELATSSSPFLANSLSNNRAGYPYTWPEGTNKIGTCLFTEEPIITSNPRQVSAPASFLELPSVTLSFKCK